MASKFKIQVQRSNGVWASLRDSEFSERLRAEAYAFKYLRYRTWRVVEITCRAA